MKGKGSLMLCIMLILAGTLAFVSYQGIGEKKQGSIWNVKQGLDLSGGVQILYEADKENVTEEEMGESGGDGIIGRFEEFEGVIEEAKDHVQSINKGLDEIDGKEVECTIKVKIETSGGGLPAGIGAGMNLECHI